MMTGYLDAISPGQGCYIVLCGEAVWVERARFGLHLQLSKLDQAFEDSEDPLVMAKAIYAYLALCGIEDAEASATELALAFGRLRQLNSWQWHLAFMLDRSTPGQQPPYDYDGRYWAWWVHKLASRYGWSRDEIFNLWPEEAAAYLQEIFVSEVDESENRRALSDVSYRYDKQSKKFHFIPMPKPGWMISDVANGGQLKKVNIPKGLLPLGNVIDQSGMGLLTGNRDNDEDTLVQ